MTRSADPSLHEALAKARASFTERGYGQFPASTYRELLGESALAQLPEVLQSFSDLGRDQYMGDGGTYRFRAYSRFVVHSQQEEAFRVEELSGNSIFQTTEDNSVNGGVLRTFAPLAPEVAGGPLLQALIRQDFSNAAACDPELWRGETVVGVHQVRIVARGQQPGLPTPEGIHRDSERFTFQHFMARADIEGGEFRAYDEQKRLLFAWLQREPLDTVMFEGTTWHSATPIAPCDPTTAGYRDIFLVDFDRP
jgi:hypothetical protein